MVVDNFIRSWLAMTVDDQRVVHYGLGETARWCLGVFYANYRMMVSQDADRLQHVMSFLVGLFQRHGLTTKLAKPRTMKFQNDALQLGMSMESKYLRCTGMGDSYRVRLWSRIP